MTTSTRPGWSDPDQRWAVLLHLLVAVTLAVPTVVVALSWPPGAATTLVVAAAYAAWYAALPVLAGRDGERQGLLVLHAVVAVALFTVLNVRDGGYILLVYSLMPLLFSSLPRGLAVVGVAALVLLPPIVSGDVRSLVRDGSALLSLLATVGLGLAVTAVIEALAAQADAQKRTIADLEQARAEVSDLLAGARRDLRDRDALARAGHALIAARTPAAVVEALASELADHSAAVLGVARVSALPHDPGHARVDGPVAGAAAPEVGSTVVLGDRPFDDGVAIWHPADAVVRSGRAPTSQPAGSSVAVLDLTASGVEARSAGTSPLDPGQQPGQLLWLLLGVSAPGDRIRRDLSMAGAEAALALAGLRLADRAAEQGRSSGILEERQRLAHELHDTLAQSFTSVVTQLEAAELALGRDRGAAVDHLDRARRTAREGLTEARRAVQALRPGPLARVPLPAAVRDVAAAWQAAQQHDVDVAVVVEGERDAPIGDVDEVLLRVVQEALFNVGRHAAARRVTITLSYLDELVLLDVQDDGRGFDVSSAPQLDDVTGGGFGLESMRARVAGVGGELFVESEPGQGTTVAARVPLARDGTGPVPSARAVRVP